MKKLLLGFVLSVAITISQFGFVAAQTSTQITGTVQTVQLETDSAGVTTVLVTLTDSTGETQTVRLSLETATSLGLVTTDSAGVTTVDSTKFGSDVSIDSTTVIETETEHPVGSALSNFFSDLIGVDYDSIMAYHDDGAGFGVIAQALWMTKQLGGDTATFDAIMTAKKTGDYSSIVLPDGSSPKNWGQFRKAVLDNKKDAKLNLGAVMSDHTDNNGNSANGNNGENGQNNGNNGNNGKGNGKSDGKGQSGDHGNGNGKP